MTILAGRAGFTAPGLIETPDSWTGLLASGLAGASAAASVAIVLTLYFAGRYRSPSDVVRHFAAASVATGLLAFAAYDMRHAAFDYLGINSAKPAVEFEIRLPNAAALAVSAGTTQIELHTDKNQTLAKLREGLASTRGRPRRTAGIGPARFPHSPPRRGAEPAGSAAAAVQIALGGEPEPFRSIRAVAPGRSRYIGNRRRARPLRAERCVRDPLPRALTRPSSNDHDLTISLSFPKPFSRFALTSPRD
jgi:hypothetical protein